MKRIAVLASGRGSNFQAVLNAVASGFIPGKCVSLITDNKDAYAITRAKECDIPVTVLHYREYPDKASYERDLIAAMKKTNADLFVCAGYMRIIGDEIIRSFSGRMINIHPSLLPAFTGLHAQRQAVQYGVKVAGCTVHFVDEGLDSGPIILQRVVPVFEDDDEDTLALRILAEEHIAYPLAIKLFCEERLEILNRTVKILPEKIL